MDRTRRKQQKRKEREERLRQQKHAVRSLPQEFGGEEVPEALLDEVGDPDEPDDLDDQRGFMEEERCLRDRLFAELAMNATPEELDAYTDEQWDAIRDERLLDRDELAQEMVFMALESESLEARIRLARSALKVDAHGFDAFTVLASHPADRDKSLHLLETLGKEAREGLAECEPLADEWLDPNRRPMLRVLAALADVLAEHERYADAQELYVEICRRTPTDPLGVRHAWIAELLELNECAEAARVLDQFEPRFPTDPVLPWLRALERVLARDFAGAMASLRAGRAAMPSLERSLFVEEDPADQGDDFVETDADVICGRLVAAPWKVHPEAWSWLRVACAIPR
jgi:hypothetical protein